MTEKRKVEAQRVKNLERALRQERLGLVAIALAFVKEAPEPARLLARLERMVEAAALNPKTAPKTTAMLHDGLTLVRRAMEQELGKPQGLFDPHVGHVQPADARDIAELPANQPVSLLPATQLTQDQEHAERQIRSTLVKALGKGPATDAELAARYRALGGAVQSRHSLYCHRVELTRLGRIRGIPTEGDAPLWGLAEHQAAA